MQSSAKWEDALAEARVDKTVCEALEQRGLSAPAPLAYCFPHVEDWEWEIWEVLVNRDSLGEEHVARTENDYACSVRAGTLRHLYDICRGMRDAGPASQGSMALATLESFEGAPPRTLTAPVGR